MQLPLPATAPPSPQLLTRIMSLDDEIVDQMVCKRIIKRSGLAQEVVSITTPAAALSYFAAPDSPLIDLILLDVNMPVMNGFEFLEAACDQLAPGQQLPPVFIMLSSALGPLHRKHAQKLDAITGYLDKPLDSAALKTAILTFQNEAIEELRPADQ